MNGLARGGEEVSVTNLGDALISIVQDASSDNEFLLVVDGLDRIIGDNKAYWLTLAALLRVGDAIHKRLRSAKASIRLLVMCRSDVFRKIRFADSDKISGDASIFIEWSAHQTEPSNSPLWDYLEKKAGLGQGKLFDLLPDLVTVGQRSGDPRRIPVAKYLLESTRSTPREMTLLMRRIQEEIPKNGYATSDRIRVAADNFASRDLLTIVGAETSGIIDDALSGRLEEVLSALPAATNLKQSDLDGAVVGAGLSVHQAKELGEFLFLTGLLGNFDPRNGHIQFHHRRDTYRFNRKGPWTLHKALMYAFNIPYTRPAPIMQ